MNLLIAASEAVPYAKTGGLADVTGALPQELAKLGHSVILVLPAYRSLADSGRTFRAVAKFPVKTAQGITEAIVEEDQIRLEGRGTAVRVWALRHDAFFDRPGLYQEEGRDYPDNLERFAWFCRAIIETIVYLNEEEGWKTDILHLHDWQTALCAVYLRYVDRRRTDTQGVKAVLTLHNVGYQGIFPGNQMERIGLPPSLFTPDGLEFYGSTNLLKGGIISADFLTTVSPTYAREILTPEFGFGLEGVLKERETRLRGIVNGIDIDQWNPRTDAFLPARYSVRDLTGKLLCKQALQREFSLPQQQVPLLAMIARLTSQKGVDLIETIIPSLMELKLQLVILGTGDAIHERNLRAVQARYPEKMGLRIGFDEGLAHRIEAGADMFIMPSRYEPCGLSQLYSLRYGTVPVVRKTGGLADTVIPMTPATVLAGTATGFVVESATADALLGTVREAVDAYGKPGIWNQLIMNGMTRDFSWAHSAAAYDELFTELMIERVTAREGTKELEERL